MDLKRTATRLLRVLIYGGIAAVVQYGLGHTLELVHNPMFVPFVTSLLTAADKAIRDAMATTT